MGRFVFNNVKVDNLAQVSAVVVHQLMDELPKDSYIKACEITEQNFDLSLRADQASVRELGRLNHLGIFAQPSSDDIADPSMVSMKIQAKVLSEEKKKHFQNNVRMP